MTSTEQEPADLTLRPAVEQDVPGVVELYFAARRAAVPAMPPPVRGADEVARHYARLLEEGRSEPPAELWVAEHEATVVGFVELEDRWLSGLYVRPDRSRQGVGSALLDLAKALRPDGFGLWVFESNEAARAFYRRHGLLDLEHSDGSDNEEGAPELRMVWAGGDPVRYLRGEIDRVDDELARLLARRAALTAAVQRFKPVPGHAGRDEDREAAIAGRMAARAPGLRPEHWRRIMHEVITVSLDAAEEHRRGG